MPGGDIENNFYRYDDNGEFQRRGNERMRHPIAPAPISQPMPAPAPMPMPFEGNPFGGGFLPMPAPISQPIRQPIRQHPMPFKGKPFSGMPTRPRMGTMDSQMYIDPITGEQTTGSSTDIGYRTKLKEYFDQNEGAQDYYNSQNVSQGKDYKGGQLLIPGERQIGEDLSSPVAPPAFIDSPPTGGLQPITGGFGPGGYIPTPEDMIPRKLGDPDFIDVRNLLPPMPPTLAEEAEKKRLQVESGLSPKDYMEQKIQEGRARFSDQGGYPGENLMPMAQPPAQLDPFSRQPMAAPPTSSAWNPYSTEHQLENDTPYTFARSIELPNPFSVEQQEAHRAQQERWLRDQEASGLSSKEYMMSQLQEQPLQPTAAPVPQIQPTAAPVLQIQPPAAPVPQIQPPAAPVLQIQPPAAPVPQIQPTASLFQQAPPMAAPIPTSINAPVPPQPFGGPTPLFSSMGEPEPPLGGSPPQPYGAPPIAPQPTQPLGGPTPLFQPMGGQAPSPEQGGIGSLAGLF